VREQELRLAGRPQIEPANDAAEGEPAFVATFEVVPDFGDLDMSKLNVVRHTADVTEQDIDRMLENLRQQRQGWTVVERAAQSGDAVELGIWLLADGKLLPYCEAALRGGAHLLQYRDKSQDRVRRFSEACQLAALCQRYQAHLIINDDLELAAELGIGLHLGQQDGSIREARARLGDNAIIGATCHNSLSLAQQALDEGASYLAFGRFFPSQTKANAPLADLSILQQAANRFNLPLVAIGGITLDNAPLLLQNGATLLAVVHGLFAQNNSEAVENRARAFVALFA